jgi:hypothetical protein
LASIRLYVMVSPYLTVGVASSCLALA